jgi:hypothetical protein
MHTVLSLMRCWGMLVRPYGPSETTSKLVHVTSANATPTSCRAHPDQLGNVGFTSTIVNSLPSYMRRSGSPTGLKKVSGG